MKNALIWIAVCVLLLMITGKVGPKHQEWGIVLVGANLFWWCAGGMMLLRAIYRFVVRQ